MTQRVLVVGDANLDLILRGDVVPRFGQVEQLLDAAELVMGGSASIVASGLARLEVPVSLVAVVGDDAFGTLALDALAASGVDAAAVRTAPGASTGLSVILATTGDRSILTDRGAIPLLTIEEVAAAASGVDWIHLASPFLVDSIVAGLPALIIGWRAAGIGVSLDTNWDPAERWTSVLPLIPLVDVLLPNRAEVEALAAALGLTEPDPAAAVAALGPRVVVKDGANGGFSVAHDGSRVHAPGLSVDVADTTGAGDSFDAGYLAAIAHAVHGEEERLRWATRAGSLSTRGTGGTATQATLADLGR